MMLAIATVVLTDKIEEGDMCAHKDIFRTSTVLFYAATKNDVESTNEAAPRLKVIFDKELYPQPILHSL